VEADERALIRGTVSHVLATHEPPGVLGALGESGFFELADEASSNVWRILFEVQGRDLIASPVLDLLVLDALGLKERALDAAIVYPTFVNGAQPPGTSAAGRVTVDGLVLAGVERAQTLFMCVVEGDDVFVASIARQAPGLKGKVVQGFDPDLGLVSVSGEVDLVDLESYEPAGTRWELAVARARRALGEEITAAADAILAQAIDHVIHREQFGAPIGVFQAVKHRLADVHVAIRSSKAALDVAWQGDDPFVDLSVKTLSGQAASLAARNCHQVCGGMGFSWEFGMHRWVRRSSVLDGLLGAATALRSEIGVRLLEMGEIPRLGLLTAEATLHEQSA
jgi:Acyl-CoA dehydrogenase, C-terminal domain